MSSSIFFRFKSQKEPLQITFDGTSLSVFEVKREIIAISKLGDGTDFDLEIYSADGNNESYDDDTTQIPRSTTVVARRLPAARAGAGKAARYVTGKMPVNAKNSHRAEFNKSAASNKNTPAMNGPSGGGGKEMTEEEKMQAILSQSNDTWRAEQENMSHKPVIRSFNKSGPVPDKPLPPSYICHRCGQKGHWIQACPTNNDPNFDGRPKFKRTTGIPRSFLKVVDKPTEAEAIGEDGKVDVSKLPKGVMYTANGEWVVAQADTATWDKIQEKQKAAAEKAKEAESGSEELRSRGLECPIDKRRFDNPHKTPCCGTTYCFTCIETALVDNDLVCPNCGEQALLDQLAPDQEKTRQIQEYEEEKKAAKESKDAEVAKSPAVAAGTPKAESPKEAKSPAADPPSATKNNDVGSAASTPNVRKRTAEDELPNDRKPARPTSNGTNRANSGQDASAGSAQSQSMSMMNTPTQPPMAPAKDLAEFQKQMNAMASSMAGMQNGIPAMMNPLMSGFNPAMMGMNMPMPPMPGNMNMAMNMPMNPAMMMNMGMPPNFGMQNNWGGPGNMGMNGGGWQGDMNAGMQNGHANDSPYMRQPVNPNRQRGRFNRPRSQDYRQL